MGKFVTNQTGSAVLTLSTAGANYVLFARNVGVTISVDLEDDRDYSTADNFYTWIPGNSQWSLAIDGSVDGANVPLITPFSVPVSYTLTLTTFTALNIVGSVLIENWNTQGPVGEKLKYSCTLRGTGIPTKWFQA